MDLKLIESTTINVGDKFVACWGYDQTQYSIYEVHAIKGKSVLVSGLNGWSNLDDNDLCEGSQVKIYSYPSWENRKPEEWGLNIDQYDYNRIMGERAKEAAEVRTITKMGRINGASWTYIWTLNNGEVVNSRELYEQGKHVSIVLALKKCLVKAGYDGKPTIKIDQSIRASHDPDFNNNAKKYAEQNEYTAYNGR